MLTLYATYMVHTYIMCGDGVVCVPVWLDESSTSDSKSHFKIINWD